MIPGDNLTISFTLKFISNTHIELNALWPSDAIWQHRSESTLAQVMACCLTAPSHYLKINLDFSLERFPGIHLRVISHTMDLLWEKFQWILPLYMKPISFQSKASVVCSVTAAIFIDFCLKKLNVFSQHIGHKTNEYLNSTEQIPRNWNVDQLSVLITSWDIS